MSYCIATVGLFVCPPACWTGRGGSSGSWKAGVQQLGAEDEYFGAGFWASREFASFPTGTGPLGLSRMGKRKARVLWLQDEPAADGGRKTPCRGRGLFPWLHRPIMERHFKRGLVTAQCWLCHHRVNFRSPREGHSAAVGEFLLFSFWATDAR